MILKLILNGDFKRIIFSGQNPLLIRWPRNDILRKHGIIPEKPPSPTLMIEEAIATARDHAHQNRLEDKDLDQLDELEDDEDAEFLEQYRYGRQSCTRTST